MCREANATDDPQSLVVHRRGAHMVLLNRYPYNSGHLMVAPRAHLAMPEELSATERAGLWELVLDARRRLAEVYAAEGFNVGLNLGKAAGAGLADHLHVHIVPRWSGDANFITTTGETRVIPEDLGITRRRLREAFGDDQD